MSRPKAIHAHRDGGNEYSTWVNVPLHHATELAPSRFSWQWHSIVMATGACSSLAHNFPYGTGCTFLEVATLVLFLLDLAIFALLCVWAVVRCLLFPEVRMLQN